jgi:hypothetical protein
VLAAALEDGAEAAVSAVQGVARAASALDADSLIPVGE